MKLHFQQNNDTFNYNSTRQERAKSWMRSFISSVKNFFVYHTKTDWQWIIIILVLAALLRLPALDYPEQSKFDEPIYTDFALLTLQGKPFFDIHPPFARMFFAEIMRHSTIDIKNSKKILAAEVEPQSFNTLPFTPLRTAVALFGTLLPLLLYGASRALRYQPRVSGMIALFAVIDSALIIYARVILPDTILLSFEVGALACAFAVVYAKSKKQSLFFIILGGFLIGLALSVKWIALAVGATMCLLYLFTKQYRAVVLTIGISLFVYVGVFVTFLNYFPNGGKLDPMVVTFDTPRISEFAFPSSLSFEHTPELLLSLHALMLTADTDEAIIEKLPPPTLPLSWAVAKVSMLGWWDVLSHKAILLQGNSILWVLTFFLFLFELGWIISEVYEKRKWPIGRDESVLLAGYLMNYIPYFFINRSMFLYHYFMALLFLFLLVPKIAPRVIACIAHLSNDKLFAKVLAGAVLLMIVVNFILMAPVTYGW